MRFVNDNNDDDDDDDDDDETWHEASIFVVKFREITISFACKSNQIKLNGKKM